MNSFDPQHKIGILGGGQLGRMLIQNSINYNLNISVLDPDANAPCKGISNFTKGSITDYDTVYKFGKDKEVITIEIENVNTEALKALEKEGKRVYPQPELNELIQDKGLQKMFYQRNKAALQMADVGLPATIAEAWDESIGRLRRLADVRCGLRA